MKVLEKKTYRRLKIDLSRYKATSQQVKVLVRKRQCKQTDLVRSPLDVSNLPLLVLDHLPGFLLRSLLLLGLPLFFLLDGLRNVESHGLVLGLLLSCWRRWDDGLLVRVRSLLDGDEGGELSLGSKVVDRASDVESPINDTDEGVGDGEKKLDVVAHDDLRGERGGARRSTSGRDELEEQEEKLKNARQFDQP